MATISMAPAEPAVTCIWQGHQGRAAPCAFAIPLGASGQESKAGSRGAGSTCRMVLQRNRQCWQQKLSCLCRHNTGKRSGIEGLCEHGVWHRHRTLAALRPAEGTQSSKALIGLQQASLTFEDCAEYMQMHSSMQTALTCCMNHPRGRRTQRRRWDCSQSPSSGGCTRPDF